VGKRLERKLATVVERGKALWPKAADVQLAPLAWIQVLMPAFWFQDSEEIAELE
jgi:hypothetical protein